MSCFTHFLKISFPRDALRGTQRYLKSEFASQIASQNCFPDCPLEELLEELLEKFLEKLLEKLLEKFLEVAPQICFPELLPRIASQNCFPEALYSAFCIFWSRRRYNFELLARNGRYRCHRCDIHVKSTNRLSHRCHFPIRLVTYQVLNKSTA